MTQWGIHCHLAQRISSMLARTIEQSKEVPSLFLSHDKPAVSNQIPELGVCIPHIALYEKGRSFFDQRTLPLLFWEQGVNPLCVGNDAGTVQALLCHRINQL